MRILLVQNKVYKDLDETLKNINKLIKEELRNLPDLIIFPEMFSTPYELKYIESYKQKLDSNLIKFLSNLAKDNHCYIVGGSLPLLKEDKIYNSSIIFNKNGEIVDIYDKIHLFEITYPDGTYFSEAKVLSKGNKIVTFDTEFGKFGVMICFDIRFPLLASKLMEKDILGIFVPAAFNTYTGPLHWTTTFRARAIDNQLFMIGCSPSSNSFGNYHTYGHSIVVNPYGKVLKELDGLENAFTIDINLNEVKEARKKIPILKNRVKL